MGFDTAYEAITEEVDDHRWAFGTGFLDPLNGVDTQIPAGVDGGDLAAYCLMLGDDALVMSHRLQEWLTRAPELEEETALANIGLDLLGQARLLLARAGKADGTERTEDDLAFLREVGEFRNVRFVEGIDADFAALIVRLLVFSTWRLATFDRLRGCCDPVLAAVADKGVKEIAYHRDYAAQWALRLGDGTDVSRRRMVDALDSLLPAAGELFQTSDVERRLSGVGVAVDPANVRPEFDDVLGEIFSLLRLAMPAIAASDSERGRDGLHTVAMGGLLEQLQGFARAHGGANW